MDIYVGNLNDYIQFYTEITKIHANSNLTADDTRTVRSHMSGRRPDNNVKNI